MTVRLRRRSQRLARPSPPGQRRALCGERASCTSSRSCSKNNADDWRRSITAEHGKVHDDALGEVTRGLEVVEFACGIPHLLKGEVTENVGTGVDSHSLRQPLGRGGGHHAVQLPGDGADVDVPGGASPAATPSSSSLPRRVPSAALLLAELLKEAGLPDGVFNVVHGDKEAVDALLDASGREGASAFVGSTPIAHYIYATGARARQARAGARRRQEPHGRHARRRPRQGRRCADGRCLRFGRRTLHGDLGRGRRGRRRWPTSWSSAW